MTVPTAAQAALVVVVYVPLAMLCYNRHLRSAIFARIGYSGSVTDKCGAHSDD